MQYALRKKIVTIARYGGVATIVIDWSVLVIFYSIYPERMQLRYTVSSFALLPETNVLFSVFFLFAVIAFWIFVQFYLSQHYKTPKKVFGLSMLGIILALIAVAIPHSPWYPLLHIVGSWTFALGFLLAITLMDRDNTQKQFRRVTRIVAVASAATLVLLFLLRPLHITLIFELAIAVICHFWILWVTFANNHMPKGRRLTGISTGSVS